MAPTATPKETNTMTTTTYDVKVTDFGTTIHVADRTRRRLLAKINDAARDVRSWTDAVRHDLDRVEQAIAAGWLNHTTGRNSFDNLTAALGTLNGLLAAAVVLDSDPDAGEAWTEMVTLAQQTTNLHITAAPTPAQYAAAQA